ncbi:hypothetical protein [Paenibacillus sp. GbtcB18]|uniref:hypothetical protein n=1 Tax=Paenibacillus sp. GbtcB18 TaxID=2824763 RepID=UPI001C30A665|nr:hypothetical protein [Paenibacillus sp. GbtcB18]
MSNSVPKSKVKDDRDIEEYLLSFFRNNPKLSPESFQGKYHHLKFEWWEVGTKELIKKPEFMYESLAGIEHEERLRIMMQYVLAVIEGYETELLEAAFGPAPKGYKKVE